MSPEIPNLGPYSSYHLVFSSDKENLSALRHILQAASLQYHYPEALVDDLILAMDEAITNIMKHAYGDNPNFLLTMKALFDAKKVQFFLYDLGKSFEPERIEKPDVEKYVKTEKRGGWGKFLIERFMDEIYYNPSPQGNTLQLVKYIESIEKHKVNIDLWKQRPLNIEDIESLEELNKQIHAVIDSLSSENYREMAVNTITKMLSNNLDTQVLLQSFLINLLDKTYAKHALIYLLSPSETSFELSHKVGVTSPTPPHFSVEEEWIQKLQTLKLSLRQTAPQQFGFEWEVLFPLLVAGKLEGILFLSKKMDESSYSQEEEKLLADLISLAGIGYRSAKLFTQVWESKKFLESIVDSFPLLLTIIDTDYQLVRANKSLLTHFKQRNFKKLLGKRCYEFFYQKEKPCASCPVASILQSKKTVIVERSCPTTHDHYRIHYIPHFNIKTHVDYITILWEVPPPSLPAPS
jgi:serine/threonine-protein kinase RsbW